MSHFVGTASFYAEFRPGYPSELWDSLTTTANGEGTGRVLELGAGPATATVELARRVGSVVAVDLDGEMVDEGRRITTAAGCTNVEWLNQPAEEIEFPDRHFGLIVIASAFHWMDRPAVAARCRSMLTEDGRIAVLGNPTPLMQIRDGSPIGAAIGEVQNRWFGEDYYVMDIDELDRPEVVLREAGFSDVAVSYVGQTQAWSVDRFLGFLRSTSSRPDQRLGDEFPRFATEMARAIRAVEPSGQWELDIPVEVIVGRP